MPILQEGLAMKDPSLRVGGSGRSRRRRGLRLAVVVERLEGRLTPVVFTVNTVADGGPGSLRQAIIDANVATSAA